jgi:high-affinity iron transporter
MLQAFIITLREGVEASLIVGIVFAYLSKIGRPELKRTVFWALGSAIAASVAGAVVLARTQFNSDIFEGWVMLGAAAFVISMIWFMHKTARTMKGSIEEKVAQYAGAAGVSKAGLFFFVFLLVLRDAAWNRGCRCVWCALHSRQRQDQSAAIFSRYDCHPLFCRVSVDRQRIA